MKNIGNMPKGGGFKNPGGFDWGQFGMNAFQALPGLMGGGTQTVQAPMPFDAGYTGMGALAAKNNFGGDPLGTNIKQSSTVKDQPRTWSDRFEDFFGGVDSTLSSPGKLVGLGLLGQINPNLAYAGLLAAGLMNARGQSDK